MTHVPLLVATLKAQLVSVASDHPADEAAAIAAWGDALGVYWTGATANGIPIVGSFVTTAVAAAKAAMTGLQTTGFTAIQAGAVAGWAAMAVPGAFGANTLATPAPAIGTLVAVLSPVLTANVLNTLSIDAACGAIATAWGPLSLGGTATFPGPAVFPIL